MYGAFSNQFSLSVEEGECVAITGPSGCGKTTLSKLLLGLYPVSEGEIQVNGKKMQEHSLREIRRQIAYVPQESYLFQGSVRDNIMLRRPEATSALDNESEQMVNDAMKNLQGSRTILMIAHRPSTIQLADRVYRM